MSDVANGSGKINGSAGAVAKMMSREQEIALAMLAMKVGLGISAKELSLCFYSVWEILLCVCTAELTRRLLHSSWNWTGRPWVLAIFSA